MSSRDRWLAALLPSMFTLLIGWFFFLRPAGRETTAVVNRAVNLGSFVPRESAVALAQSEREALAQKLAARRAEAPPPELAPFDRGKALQQVSDWCGEHGLALISTAAQPATQLPASLKEAMAAAPRAPGGPVPQIWRLELLGTYPAVTRLLEKLATATPSIVPITLSMEPGQSSRQPSRWALQLLL